MKQATEKSIQKTAVRERLQQDQKPNHQSWLNPQPHQDPSPTTILQIDLSITCFKRVLGAPNGKSNTRNSTLNSTLNTDSLQPWLQVLAKVIFSSPTLQQCLPFWHCSSVSLFQLYQIYQNLFLLNLKAGPIWKLSQFESLQMIHMQPNLKTNDVTFWKVVFNNIARNHSIYLSLSWSRWQRLFCFKIKVHHPTVYNANVSQKVFCDIDQYIFTHLFLLNLKALVGKIERFLIWLAMIKQYGLVIWYNWWGISHIPNKMEDVLQYLQLSKLLKSWKCII